MEVKVIKKITKKLNKIFPTLFGSTVSLERTEKQVYLLFIELGEPVALVDLTYQDFKLMEGKPMFSIYIDRFEVSCKDKGKHIGTEVFNWLQSEIEAYEFVLTYMSYDKGESRKFWSSLGFRRVYDYEYSTLMKKKIKTG